MKIPGSFKLGLVEYKVILADSIVIENDLTEVIFGRTHKKFKTFGGVTRGSVFGACDPTTATIYLLVKDDEGNDMSEGRIIQTFSHELAHALVGETAHLEVNADEVFIEALGKNILSYIQTNTGEPQHENDEVEEEEIPVKPKSKTKK